MKRIKIMPSAYIMLAAMLVSNRIGVLLLYFLSAALHELGHLAAAYLSKVEITDVRFTYSGIRMHTGNKMMSYKQELVTAIAGPLSNLIVISICAALLMLNGSRLDHCVSSCNDLLINNMFTFSGAFGFVMLSSFLQGCINLLPVRTLDGGRVIYCALALIFGDRVACSVLDILSIFTAFLLWTVALYLMLKASSGLGIYVFSACLFFGVFKKSSDNANVRQ